MKRTMKTVGVALLLVAVLTVAVILYDRLGADYGGDPIPGVEPDAETEGKSESDTEAESKGESESEKKNEDEVISLPYDFTVLDAGGNEVKLSDFVGKPIVLNFWATWCGYCVMEMPDFNDAYKAYPDVQFLMVNATHSSWTETVATAKAYVEKEGYDFDVFYDTAGEAQAVFALNSYPQTFFFNEKGELVAHRPGAMNYSMLVSYIEAIIK